jgi:hypothetical protein
MFNSSLVVSFSFKVGWFSLADMTWEEVKLHFNSSQALTTAASKTTAAAEMTSASKARAAEGLSTSFCLERPVR